MKQTAQKAVTARQILCPLFMKTRKNVMIRKFRYGAPFDTEALTEEIETADGAFPYGKISLESGFDFLLM